MLARKLIKDEAIETNLFLKQDKKINIKISLPFEPLTTLLLSLYCISICKGCVEPCRRVQVGGQVGLGWGQLVASEWRGESGGEYWKQRPWPLIEVWAA